MQLSPKQKDFWNNSNSRWNIKSGATRSGKTYLDYYMIPRRIRATKNNGLIVLLGNTQGTLERNILDPLRNIWGKGLVGIISSNNKVKLFGKEAYALGADKKNAVTKIQGAGIEYCYGDEVTTWSEDVFNMLKSRLDKPNSLFDGTCNPDNPQHWFKKFLDSDANIYHQHYTIDDNPFLTPKFVEELKKEYSGTVYYNRFILGQWMRAEGAIYRLFADDPKKYKTSLGFNEYTGICNQIFETINIGVDFGGNKSNHTFVATGITRNFQKVIILVSEKHKADTDPDELNTLFINFVRRVQMMYGKIDAAYCDSAEQVLIRGFKTAILKNDIHISIKNSLKIEIVNRIRLVASLIATNRFFYTDDSITVKEALCQAVWDEKQLDSVRLDDGTSDIDTLDAMEYSIEKYHKRLMMLRG